MLWTKEMENISLHFKCKIVYNGTIRTLREEIQRNFHDFAQNACKRQFL
eukprot:UN12189